MSNITGLGELGERPRGSGCCGHNGVGRRRPWTGSGAERVCGLRLAACGVRDFLFWRQLGVYLWMTWSTDALMLTLPKIYCRTTVLIKRWQWKHARFLRRDLARSIIDPVQSDSGGPGLLRGAPLFRSHSAMCTSTRHGPYAAAASACTRARAPTRRRR